MTRTLILTRHAKSSWDSSAPSDHARPLNKRGRHSAAALGNWLRDTQRLPDQVISSSSQRTRETHQLMELTAPASFTERLYHASAELILSALREASGQRVLMLGHNPGIGEFAHKIVTNPPDHSRFEDYPTGATLVVEFATDDWSTINWGMGRVLDFTVPRELLGEAV